MRDLAYRSLVVERKMIKRLTAGFNSWEDHKPRKLTCTALPRFSKSITSAKLETKFEKRCASFSSIIARFEAKIKGKQNPFRSSIACLSHHTKTHLFSFFSLRIFVSPQAKIGNKICDSFRFPFFFSNSKTNSINIFYFKLKGLSHDIFNKFLVFRT